MANVFNNYQVRFPSHFCEDTVLISKKDIVQLHVRVCKIFVCNNENNIWALLEHGLMRKASLIGTLPPLKLLKDGAFYFIPFLNSDGQLELRISGRVHGGGQKESTGRKSKKSLKEKKEYQGVYNSLSCELTSTLKNYFGTSDHSLPGAGGKNERVLNQDDFILLQKTILKHKEEHGSFEQGLVGTVNGELYDSTKGYVFFTPLLWVLGGYNPSCTLEARLIIAEMLLKAGASPNTCAWDYQNPPTPVKNISPLAFVIRMYANAERTILSRMVSLLLYHGGDPKSEWIQHDNPKSKINNVSALAKKWGREDVVELLKKAIQEGPKSISWDSPLDRIQDDLFAELNRQKEESEHYKALMEAIKKGKKETVELLLKKHVPNYFDKHFEVAVELGDQEIFDLLLKYGQDKLTDYSSVLGAPPRQKNLVISVIRAGIFADLTLLGRYRPYFWAAHCGWDDVIEELDKANIEDSGKENCLSQLLICAQNNHVQPNPESIKILCSRTQSKAWEVSTELRVRHADVLGSYLYQQGNVNSLIEKILRNLPNLGEVKASQQENNLKAIIFKALVGSDVSQCFAQDVAQTTSIRKEIHDLLLEKLTQLLKLEIYFDKKNNKLNIKDIFSEIMDSLSAIDAQYKKQKSEEEAEKKRDQDLKNLQAQYDKIVEEQRALAAQIESQEEIRQAAVEDNKRLTAEIAAQTERLKRDFNAKAQEKEDDVAHQEFMGQMAAYHGWKNY